MKKLTTFVILSVFFLCCTSCAEYKEYQEKQLSMVDNSYLFPAFSKVVVKGNARVELVKKDGVPRLYCKGTKQDVDNIYAQVKGDTLYISSPVSAPAIKLAISNLSFIGAKDNSIVVVANFHAKNLGIFSSDAGSISIEGPVGLTAITQMGRGEIGVRWVDSDKLTVVGVGSGHIYLSGVTNTLEAKLEGSTYLDARYLRANMATVMTTDQTRADVLAVDVLNAYAGKGSNVYYHKRSLQINKVSVNSGNIFLTEEMR